MKTNFHNKNSALSLAFMMRLKALGNGLLLKEVLTSQFDYFFLVTTAPVQRRLKKLVSTRVIVSTFDSCFTLGDMFV